MRALIYTYNFDLSEQDKIYFLKKHAPPAMGCALSRQQMTLMVILCWSRYKSMWATRARNSLGIL